MVGQEALGLLSVRRLKLQLFYLPKYSHGFPIHPHDRFGILRHADNDDFYHYYDENVDDSNN